jgi:hypothetical protein
VVEVPSDDAHVPVCGDMKGRRRHLMKAMTWCNNPFKAHPENTVVQHLNLFHP